MTPETIKSSMLGFDALKERRFNQGESMGQDTPIRYDNRKLNFFTYSISSWHREKLFVNSIAIIPELDLCVDSRYKYKYEYKYRYEWAKN